MIDRFKLVIRYIKYLLKARHYNGHGVHSPFIYNFTREVLFKKDSNKNYTIVSNYKKQLKNDERVIEMTDYGAKSKVFKGKQRKVSDIALKISTKKKYGKLLARLVKYYKPDTIIELGSALGVGSIYLSQFLKNTAKLITIEGNVNLAEIASEELAGISGKSIRLINDNFNDVLPKLTKDNISFDIVYFDGNHTRQATISYFEQCLIKANEGSIFIFDDIHWSTEMEEAWEYIKLHKRTKVCIDLFQLGIVFFRKELTKQNFTILF